MPYMVHPCQAKQNQAGICGSNCSIHTTHVADVHIPVLGDVGLMPGGTQGTQSGDILATPTDLQYRHTLSQHSTNNDIVLD